MLFFFTDNTTESPERFHADPAGFCWGTSNRWTQLFAGGDGMGHRSSGPSRQHEEQNTLPAHQESTLAEQLIPTDELR